MATKTIQTRIKNRFDTLTNWQGQGVSLLPGEIALVSVTTQQIDQATGDVVNVPAVLIKVGEEGKTFSELPWVSALAADVYDWAKNATAEDVPVTIQVGSTSTPSTLGGWIKSINDKAATNASDISAVSAKVDVDKVSTAISDAINALDYNSSTTDESTSKIAFVTAVTQTNGKIAVTKRNIIEADLPSISSDKITIGTDVTEGTLSKKLSTMDAAIAANTGKLAGHTDAAINTLIDNKINELDGGTDSGSAGSDKYVSKVVQTNGKVATTYTSFPTAGENAGIVKLGVTGGAATYDSIYGSDGKGGINAQVEANKADIANLKTVIAGGVHFIGTTTTDVTTNTNKVSKNVTIDSKTVEASQGDIVIYNTREFIWTGSAWEELGDVTRLGELETKIGNLDVTTTNAVATTHKFVSQVTQTDGKVAVTYTQPTSADVSHTEGTATTVKATLEAHAAAIANKSDSGHTHNSYVNQNAFTHIKTSDGTVSADTATDTVEFAGTNVTITGTDATNDKITFAVADGTTSAKGLVQLSSAVNSTSEVLAATPKAVKSAYDLAAEAKADAAAKAPASHEHPAYVNQNAFSKIAVSGQTPVEADAATDTVTFAGSNVTIATDAANNKVTFTVADGSTSTKGIVQLDDTVTSNSTSLAATANAVKTAYNKGAEGVAAAAAIAENYVKISNDNLVNQAGDVIIFDCGGAADI